MSLVRDVLSKKGGDVATIQINANAMDAAILMNQRRIGAVMVMDGQKIAGIFTERDMMNRVVAQRRDPAATPVREVMTTRVAVCERDTTLEECRAVMSRNKMRHLPVVEDGRLLGMISSGDIMAREIVEQEETIRYLHEYMQGPN